MKPSGRAGPATPRPQVARQCVQAPVEQTAHGTRRRHEKELRSFGILKMPVIGTSINRLNSETGLLKND